MGLNLYA